MCRCRWRSSYEHCRRTHRHRPAAGSKPKARDLDYGWQSGNQVELLENGEAYFPKVFEALRQAQREILLETFILFEDKVGLELQGVCIEAARRGVKVVGQPGRFWLR